MLLFTFTRYCCGMEHKVSCHLNALDYPLARASGDMLVILADLCTTDLSSYLRYCCDVPMVSMSLVIESCRNGEILAQIFWL